MFEQLNRLQEPATRRAAGGLAVSVLFHGVLLVALLSAGEAAREGRAVPEAARRGPATVASVEGAPARGIAGEDGGVVPDAVEAASPAIDLALPPLTLPGEVLAAANIPRLTPRLPDTLELGRAHTLRLALPRNRLPEDSVVFLPDAAIGISRVRIARAWQVTLYGADLVVEPRTPPLQLTDSLRRTEWQWTITPTQPGPRTVFLQIDAPAEVNGQPAVVTLQRMQQQVYVHATALQRVSRFFARHWTWLSLLGVAAALGWARARLRRA
jgi:hypothetical protein